MDTKKEIWLKGVLDSSNGIQQAEASPFFVAKTIHFIHHKQAESKRSINFTFQLSLIILGILMILNLFTLYRSGQTKNLAELKSALNNNLELYE